MGSFNQGLNKESSNYAKEEINNCFDTKSNEEEKYDSFDKEEEEKGKDDSAEIKEEDKQMTDEFIIPDIQTNRKEPKVKDLIKKISRKKIFLTKKRNKKLKPENIRKSAFYYPMMFLKKLFYNQFGLNFDSFNCEKVFGIGQGNMKQFLDKKIYQILSYYPDYYTKIIEFANSKMSKEKKYMFFYFMTRTYEELYKHYISGNANYPCIPDSTLRICGLTLNSAIKFKKLQQKNEDKEYIENYIQIFKNLSENMIINLKNQGKDEGEENLVKLFKPKICKQFEDMRNKFKRKQFLEI